MACPTLLLRAGAVVLLGLSGARAQSLLAPRPVALGSPAEFQPAPHWRPAGGLDGNPRRDPVLVPRDGTGLLVTTPGGPERNDLRTKWDHGDLELDLDFLLAPGAQAQVCLQGRYAVQLADQALGRALSSADCGGIGPSAAAHAPKANAARAAGLWQHLHLEFQAPRFEAGGKKSKSARFVRVVLNGFVVQEDVEMEGPTEGADPKEEGAAGPLVIQGVRGSLALRALAVKRFGPDRITTRDLQYDLYPGDYKSAAEFEKKSPQRTGALERFSIDGIEKSGRFALVIRGTLTVPRGGIYAFSAAANGAARLAIADHPVIRPLENGSAPGRIALEAGDHPFRLDLLQTSAARATLDLTAEGPDLAPQLLTVRAARPGREGGGSRSGAAPPKQILLTAVERTRVQRSFVPFEPRKRLYAINVGSPLGVHYAYDLETGALLRVWRGGFLDAFEMWDGRGENQLAKPAGPALTLSGKPVVALLEHPASADWPEQPEALWSSQGYQLASDGTPEFRSRLAELRIRDHYAALGSGEGLGRTFEAEGNLPSWSAWLLLAEADIITPQPDGHGWVIGDRIWYLDWPADAPQLPVLRERNGHAQLALPLTRANLGRPVHYSLLW